MWIFIIKEKKSVSIWCHYSWKESLYNFLNIRSFRVTSRKNYHFRDFHRFKYTNDWEISNQQTPNISTDASSSLYVNDASTAFHPHPKFTPAKRWVKTKRICMMLHRHVKLNSSHRRFPNSQSQAIRFKWWLPLSECKSNHVRSSPTAMSKHLQHRSTLFGFWI